MVLHFSVNLRYYLKFLHNQCSQRLSFRIMHIQGSQRYQYHGSCWISQWIASCDTSNGKIVVPLHSMDRMDKIPYWYAISLGTRHNFFHMMGSFCAQATCINFMVLEAWVLLMGGIFHQSCGGIPYLCTSYLIWLPPCSKFQIIHRIINAFCVPCFQ